MVITNTRQSQKPKYISAQIQYSQADPDWGLSSFKISTQQVSGNSDTEFSRNHKVPAETLCKCAPGLWLPWERTQRLERRRRQGRVVRRRNAAIGVTTSSTGSANSSRGSVDWSSSDGSPDRRCSVAGCRRRASPTYTGL